MPFDDNNLFPHLTATPNDGLTAAPEKTARFYKPAYQHFCAALTDSLTHWAAQDFSDKRLRQLYELGLKTNLFQPADVAWHLRRTIRRLA